MEKKNTTISSAFFWKFLERFGVQGTQFVLQIVLARILDPDHYGVLSLMVIFTTLANVFIQRGFNTALIQNKDVTEEDYSSVFWVTLCIAAILYGTLYVSAPLIAAYYSMPDLVQPFRVLCLVLFPGALNSIQLAKVSRALDFKKVFRSNVAAILVAGVAGIILACMGAGLWALVAQNLLNVSVACAVMWVTVKWRPKLICNFARIKVLFSYGWKLLVSGLLDTLYQDLRSLVIGRKYNASTLAYYNRGKQFPQFIINAINTSVQSVMLPAMSSVQDDRVKIKSMMRNSISISAYIIFPMMMGLAGVAKPLVTLLLTDKWAQCVPYLQMYCVTFAFYPVHSCNLQAINAMGRSDVFLKLEIIKKTIGVVALIIAVVYFDSPLAIAATGVFTGFLSFFINAAPNRKLVAYSYGEQIRDILPACLASGVMLLAVLSVQKLQMSAFATMMVQIILGVAVYVLLSVVFRIRTFRLLVNMLTKKLRKK